MSKILSFGEGWGGGTDIKKAPENTLAIYMYEEIVTANIFFYPQNSHLMKNKKSLFEMSYFVACKYFQYDLVQNFDARKSKTCICTYTLLSVRDLVSSVRAS